MFFRCSMIVRIRICLQVRWVKNSNRRKTKIQSSEIWQTSYSTRYRTLDNVITLEASVGHPFMSRRCSVPWISWLENLHFLSGVGRQPSKTVSYSREVEDHEERWGWTWQCLQSRLAGHCRDWFAEPLLGRMLERSLESGHTCASTNHSGYSSWRHA